MHRYLGVVTGAPRPRGSHKQTWLQNLATKLVLLGLKVCELATSKEEEDRRRNRTCKDSTFAVRYKCQTTEDGRREEEEEEEEEEQKEEARARKPTKDKACR